MGDVIKGCYIQGGSLPLLIVVASAIRQADHAGTPCAVPQIEPVFDHVVLAGGDVETLRSLAP